MKYALFKRVAVVDNGRDSIDFHPFAPLFRMMTEEQKRSEGWKEGETKANDRLEFVAFTDSPKEVADAVRKAPLERYILFRGDFINVKVAIPVFVEGMSLDSMQSEFGGWEVEK